jgi:PIN domain nuclease of toxin-antitoxin system
MRFLLDTSILIRVLNVGADRLPAGLRLLLAQCQVEDLRLITSDRALVAHPLVWTERAD